MSNASRNEMKAFLLRGPSEIDSLRIEDVPAPGPLGPGQIRVAMRAASINFRDLLFVSGAIQRGDNLTPGSDGTGEVIEVAPDVWRVKVGDRVALTFNVEWIGGAWEASPTGSSRGGTVQGVMCEQAVVHQNEAVLLPPHLSYQEGATLPCAGVTAWGALCGARPLLPGMTVLLQGGGGVSIFALQFAKLFGARVIMTSSSAERCARLKQLGADETINYQADPSWDVAARKLTQGKGVDLAVDVGGAKTIDRSMAATRIDGRVAIVGMLTGVPNPSTPLLTSGVDLTSIKVGSRQDFEAMNRAIAFHEVRPVIDSTFPFQGLVEALHRLRSGKHLGKIVIDFHGAG
jgi:NADPH:quinone reductase-like Zn-dependent oxidoreductase